jgi:hypothetical protein
MLKTELSQLEEYNQETQGALQLRSKIAESESNEVKTILASVTSERDALRQAMASHADVEEDLEVTRGKLVLAESERDALYERVMRHTQEDHDFKDMQRSMEVTRKELHEALINHSKYKAQLLGFEEDFQRLALERDGALQELAEQEALVSECGNVKQALHKMTEERDELKRERDELEQRVRLTSSEHNSHASTDTVHEKNVDVTLQKYENAQRDLEAMQAQRDAAHAERDALLAEKKQSLNEMSAQLQAITSERDTLMSYRDAAYAERDALISAQQRPFVDGAHTSNSKAENYTSEKPTSEKGMPSTDNTGADCSETTALVLQRDALCSEKDALAAEIEAHRTEKEMLRSQLQEQTSQLQQQTSQYAELRRECDRLQAEGEEMRREYDTLHAESEGFRREYEKLRAESHASILENRMLCNVPGSPTQNQPNSNETGGTTIQIYASNVLLANNTKFDVLAPLTHIPAHTGTDTGLLRTKSVSAREEHDQKTDCMTDELDRDRLAHVSDGTHEKQLDATCGLQTHGAETDMYSSSPQVGSIGTDSNKSEENMRHITVNTSSASCDEKTDQCQNIVAAQSDRSPAGVTKEQAHAKTSRAEAIHTVRRSKLYIDSNSSSRRQSGSPDAPLTGHMTESDHSPSHFDSILGHVNSPGHVHQTNSPLAKMNVDANVDVDVDGTAAAQSDPCIDHSTHAAHHRGGADVVSDSDSGTNPLFENMSEAHRHQVTEQLQMNSEVEAVLHSMTSAVSAVCDVLCQVDQRVRSQYEKQLSSCEEGQRHELERECVQDDKAGKVVNCGQNVRDAIKMAGEAESLGPAQVYWLMFGL